MNVIIFGFRIVAINVFDCQSLESVKEPYKKDWLLDYYWWQRHQIRNSLIDRIRCMHCTVVQFIHTLVTFFVLLLFFNVHSSFMWEDNVHSIACIYHNNILYTINTMTIHTLTQIKRFHIHITYNRIHRMESLLIIIITKRQKGHSALCTVKSGSNTFWDEQFVYVPKCIMEKAC